jgi:hypothetical protein
MEKYALLARLEAKVGKEDRLLHFKKCFAVSTRRARHCELVWITNGTIYLWNFDDTLKLRKVEKHILKVKLQKL